MVEVEKNLLEQQALEDELLERALSTQRSMKVFSYLQVAFFIGFSVLQMYRLRKFFHARNIV